MPQRVRGLDLPVVVVVFQQLYEIALGIGRGLERIPFFDQPVPFVVYEFILVAAPVCLRQFVPV
jgi:hypothetical protein